jgi:hypothetical protein
MSDLSSIAPAFVDMAHRIVWATVATVDSEGRPRGWILHTYWQWDGTALASAAFAGLRLEPWRLRVQPGSALLGQGGAVLCWAAGPGGA